MRRVTAVLASARDRGASLGRGTGNIGGPHRIVQGDRIVHRQLLDGWVDDLAIPVGVLRRHIQQIAAQRLDAGGHRVGGSLPEGDEDDHRGDTDHDAERGQD